jgi:hypothetical protein
MACTNVCIAAERLKMEGAMTTWDGSYFQASTCGAGKSCFEDACAPPGKYLAHMCAYPDGEDGGAGPFCSFNPQAVPAKAVCVEVPFDFPSTGVVEGTIGPK